MSCDRVDGSAVRFTPHWTDILHFRTFIPAVLGTVFAFVRTINGKFGTTGVILSALFFSITLAILLFSEIRRRRTTYEITGGLLKAATPSRQAALRLQNTERVEIGGTWVMKLFGGARLKVYSDASRKAWLSVRVSKKHAKAIAKQIVPLGEETGRMISVGHSSAVYAITTQRTTLLLIASAFFTISARNSIWLNTFSACLLAAATTDMLYTAVHYRGLSLLRFHNGFRVTEGFFGSKESFLPDSAIAGAVIRRSPAALLCGFGSLGLITSGGNVILCACRINCDDTISIAMKLIGTQDNFSARLSDTAAIRKQYAFEIIPTLFFLFLSAYFAVSLENPAARFFACLAGTFTISAAISCIVGFSFAGCFGLKISPSVVFAGGMYGCNVDDYYYRRNCISGVRVSSGVFRRMNGLCSAQPFTGNGRHGVKCRCVSYGAVNGFAARFCG